MAAFGTATLLSGAMLFQQSSELIDLKTAQAIVSQNDQPVRAVHLSKALVGTLSESLKNNRSAAGVRLYAGKDSTGAAVNVIVLTDENGKDLTQKLYKTNSAAGYCPYVCDAESPLMPNE